MCWVGSLLGGDVTSEVMFSPSSNRVEVSLLRCSSSEGRRRSEPSGFQRGEWYQNHILILSGRSLGYLYLVSPQKSQMLFSHGHKFVIICINDATLSLQGHLTRCS